MSESVLSVRSLTMQFGGLKAVSQFEVDIGKKQIFGLIGPNGAGKTTVFNMLTGVYRPTSGTIRAFGTDIVGFRPFEITKKGLARTFQNIRLFKNLTVEENILVSLDAHPESPTYGFFSSIFETPRKIQTEKKLRERAEKILEVFKLGSRRHLDAQNLPYGDQRRLEIARALATGAKLVLLDEPAAGMNPQETLELMGTIHQIRDDFDVTVLLIEHDMKLVMGIYERIAVLDHGVKIAEGSPSEIKSNPKVIEAYLGTQNEH